MANYNDLKTGIDAVIKTNGRQEISGAALNAQLKNMITELGAGYQYMGVATPATNPGTPDANVFYLASGAGTYTNFGGIVINEGEVCTLVWNGTWTKEVTGIASADKLNQLGQQVIYDVSANNDGATFASLSALLSSENLSTLIPVAVRCGGMSIRFVQTSDNKCVQYRLTSPTWSIIISDWEITPCILDTTPDFAISDESGNSIVRFKDGEIETEKFDSAQTATVSDNIGNCDFAISDENGNLIVRFKDGEIETEKFDSADNKTLYKFKGKKIGLIADSITTYAGWLPSDIPNYDGQTYATYYPAGNVNDVTKTWWYKMAVALGLNPSTDISNCAWSGSRVSGDSESTTNAYAGCSTRRISDLLLRGFTPDIIICYISCNDWGNSPNVPIGTWAVTDPIPTEGVKTTLRDAYALMINKLHTAYPNARVFCCTNLDDMLRDQTPGWPSNNSLGVSTYEWNQNIIEVAHALGCDVIDLNHCGINYANIAQFAVDAGLHPNAKGMEMLAQKVVAELIAKY